MVDRARRRREVGGRPPPPMMKLERAEEKRATSRNPRATAVQTMPEIEAAPSPLLPSSEFIQSVALPFMSDACLSPLPPPPPTPAPLSAPIGRLMAAGGDGQRLVGVRTAGEDGPRGRRSGGKLGSTKLFLLPISRGERAVPTLWTRT